MRSLKKSEELGEGALKGLEDVPVVKDIVMTDVGNADVVSHATGDFDIWFDAPKDIVVRDGTLMFESI